MSVKNVSKGLSNESLTRQQSKHIPPCTTPDITLNVSETDQTDSEGYNGDQNGNKCRPSP